MTKGKKRAPSDEISSSPDPAGSNPPPAGLTPWDGAALESARKSAHKSLDEIADRTKINVAILRALEQERFEDAPKARVYIRGFVRCLAEEVGLEPDAVAKSYLPRWERWFANHDMTPPHSSRTRRAGKGGKA